MPITKFINGRGYTNTSNITWTSIEQFDIVFSTSDFVLNGKVVKRLLKKGFPPSTQVETYDENGEFIQTINSITSTIHFILSTYSGDESLSMFSVLNTITPTITIGGSDNTPYQTQTPSNYGEPLEIIFVADEGYTMNGANVDITMNGVDVKEPYYDATVKERVVSGGTVIGTRLFIDSVSGNVNIIVRANLIDDVTIHFHLSDLEPKSDITTTIDDEITFTIESTPTNPKSVKNDYRIMMDGNDITPRCIIEWEHEYLEEGLQQRMNVTIPSNIIYADVDVYAVAENNPIVTYHVTGCEPTTNEFVFHQSTLRMGFDVENGFSKFGQQVKVVIDNVIMEHEISRSTSAKFNVVVRDLNLLDDVDVYVDALEKKTLIVGETTTNYAFISRLKATADVSNNQIIVELFGAINEHVRTETYYISHQFVEHDVFIGLANKPNTKRPVYSADIEYNNLGLHGKDLSLYAIIKNYVQPTTFEIQLFKSSAEPNVVDKTSSMEYVDTLNGVLRSGTTIVNPTISVEIANVPSFNYVYIPIFNRYYFVTDVVSIVNGLWGIGLRCDVLMSFSDKILRQTALIGRNEFEYNPDIVDNQRLIEKEMDYEIVDISDSTNKFSPIDETKFLNNFVLTVISLKDNPINRPFVSTTNNKITNPCVPKMTYENAYNRKWILYSEIDVFGLNYLMNNVPSSMKAFFNDPKQYFLSLKVYPFDVTKWFHHVDYSQLIQFGDITDEHASGKPVRYAKSLQMGHYTFTRKFNDFMDFMPYTSASLYLPYIGFVDVPWNEIVGKEIKIMYSIDFDNGRCVAHINTVEGEQSHTIAIHEGDIGIDVPIGSNNAHERMTQRIMNTLNVSSGMIQTTIGVASKGIGTAGGVSRGISTLSSALISEMSSEQIHVQRNQKLSGNMVSAYSPQSLYLIITRPKPIPIDENYNRMKGRPLGEYKTLSLMEGFTIVDDIHLEGFDTATDNEIREIERLLKTGVHF